MSDMEPFSLIVKNDQVRVANVFNKSQYFFYIKLII